MEKTKIKRRRGRPAGGKSIDKKHILKIALQAFAERGFQGVTIRTISKRVKVDDSLLHYHFGKKENLWKEAVRIAYQKYTTDSKNIIRVTKDLDLLTLGKTLLRHFIHYNGKNPELYQVILHEMTMHSDRSNWLIEHILNPLSERVGKLHQAQLAAGFVKPMPIANLTSILLGACNTIFILNYQMKNQFQLNVFDEKEIDKHADLVIESIYSGIEL